NELFVGAGSGVLAVLVGYSAATAPLAAVGWLALAAVLAGVFAFLADRWLRTTSLPASVRMLAAFVVFAQAFDGTTTAVGIDALGFGEQSRLSAAVLSLASRLPIAPLLGAGWVFVTLKVLLAVAIVSVLTREGTSRGTVVLLGMVAFAGLGPAVHNVVLFTTAG
ncbi:MAG: DUF63 family protein, partial [Halapricum sp.]